MRVGLKVVGENIAVYLDKWSVTFPDGRWTTYHHDNPQGAVKTMFDKNESPTPEFPSGKDISEVLESYLSGDPIDTVYLPRYGISVEKIVLTKEGLRAMQILYLKEPYEWSPARWEGGIYPANNFARADTLPDLINKMNKEYVLQKGTIPSVEKILNEVMGLACSQGEMLENKKTVAV